MASSRNVYRIEQIAADMGDAPFGSLLKNEDYTNFGALVVQGKNIQGRVCDWSDRRFVSLAKYKSLSRSHCFPGDLVFPKVGTIGKVGILTPAKGVNHYVLSTNTMRLRINSEMADPNFVYYFFRWPKISALINALNSKSVQPVFNFTTLKGFEIQLPPLIEQREIGRILGALDDKIELNRNMNETLEAMARAIFKSWFTDFDPVRAKAEGRDMGMPKHISNLFPDSFENSELGETPRGWMVKTAGELAKISGGSTPDTKNPTFWEDGRHSWATPKDLSGLRTPVLLETERKITDSGLSQIASGLLPRGTVLLSSRAPIGYLAISEIPVAVNQGFIAMQPGPDISNLFLLLWAESAQEEIVSRANGSTFLEISKGNFRPIPVVTPPHLVLAAFERLVRPLYSRIVTNECEARTLTHLRDSLLPKLISGELRIPDAERVVGRNV
jgi:type I restriction enzyme S subunit